ncbi:MAG: hypothetical protein CSA85_00090 [Alphaproteobacteria bacterium]|nr:MAG: hypothetical protein CSA85_00090 [Alphaproteobacteria bacterium]
MTELTKLTYINGWDLPVDNEVGLLSLLELNDGSYALVLGNASYGSSGVIVSKKLAMMLKDELLLADPRPVEESAE